MRMPPNEISYDQFQCKDHIPHGGICQWFIIYSSFFFSCRSSFFSSLFSSSIFFFLASSLSFFILFNASRLLVDMLLSYMLLSV